MENRESKKRGRKKEIERERESERVRGRKKEWRENERDKERMERVRSDLHVRDLLESLIGPHTYPN